LLGAPPPDMPGHDEPGSSPKPCARPPYSVVLFARSEQGAPRLWPRSCCKILDDGRVTDAKGRAIDFRHCAHRHDQQSRALRSRSSGCASPNSSRPPSTTFVVFAELGAAAKIERIVELQLRAFGRASRGGGPVLARVRERRRAPLPGQAKRRLRKRRSVRRSRVRSRRYVTTPLSSAILAAASRPGQRATSIFGRSAITVRAA